ncbi:hypothetical protein [Pontivivens ytuae]|uniref:Component of SufBCD complex n=1 Tax=Pontivivens ytuae TaxID=2789856 RepID=A0A7S9LS69_9RHOB|nr:hypothetical protein [Pontivivens ytuae]QPH54331.1 hypothetical protein I0K15_00695 [Pontivivens ytuae]
MGDVVRNFIDFDSFSSLWYWIFMALAWTSRTHWTIGVPFDAIIRADRRGPPWEEHVDVIAHAMAARFHLFVRRGGAWVVGVTTFALTAVGTAALLFGNEFAQAIFAVALPMVIAEAGDVRLALRIHDEQLSGYELRRAIVWRRFLNQATGLFSILLASAFATFQFLQQAALAIW